MIKAIEFFVWAKEIAIGIIWFLCVCVVKKAYFWGNWLMKRRRIHIFCCVVKFYLKIFCSFFVYIVVTKLKHHLLGNIILEKINVPDHNRICIFVRWKEKKTKNKKDLTSNETAKYEEYKRKIQTGIQKWTICQLPGEKDYLLEN